MDTVATEQNQRTMHAVGGVVANQHAQRVDIRQPWHEHAHGV
jgi:hypothetical protein